MVPVAYDFRLMRARVPRTIFPVMTGLGPTTAREPLFAQSAPLWLRVWLVTQAVATLVASYVAVDRRGPTIALALIVSALVAYHAVGAVAHGWITRRIWAVLLYVPLGWVLVFVGLRLSAAFALLILGAIIEGLIFLSFAWAAPLLVVVTVALTAVTSRRQPGESLSVVFTRVGLVLATGVMIATVLLYIHRANRETALRTRLLEQLADTQRDLAHRAREAGMLDERHRLARDIHDTLAQAFTSVIKHLEAVELALDAASSGDGTHDVRPSVMPHLAHAQHVSRASLVEIREVLHALRPVVLSDAPLAGALARVVEQWGSANGVDASLASESLPSLLPDADVVLLRATQEALSNVARHAHAARVSVGISCVDGLLLLTVEDDGVGFAQSGQNNVEHMGLGGMRERVRRFGGHVLLESTEGSGTTVTVALPLATIVANA